MAVCSWCRGEMATAGSCSISAFHRGGRTYPHIPFGAETGPYRHNTPRCGDCRVERGGFHHPGCDVQQCPACRGQLLSCGCRFDEDRFDEDGFDDGFDDDCDCEVCTNGGRAPGETDAALREVLTRLSFTYLMCEMTGRDSSSLGDVIAGAAERAEPFGVDVNGNVTMTSRLGDVEVLLRLGEYPDCDVLDLDGFSMTTPLRSLIDRATEISELDTSRNLARFMAMGFFTPADAWQRVAQPDMATHPGAAVLRRLLPPTPREN